MGTTFRNATAIKTFPELVYFTKITTLVGYAFSGSTITKIILPDNVTSIGNSVFYLSTKLKYVDYGAGVTSFGSQVHYRVPTSAYKTMIVRSTTPPTLSSTSNFVPAESIYVPDSAVSTYKAASGWSTWSSRIKPISQAPSYDSV